VDTVIDIFYHSTYLYILKSRHGSW